MELLLEIAFDFLLECILANFSNKKVKRWIRLPLLLLMYFVFISLFVSLVVNGSNAITKGEIGKGFLLLGCIIVQIGIGYWYIAKRKRVKTPNVEVLDEAQTTL